MVRVAIALVVMLLLPSVAWAQAEKRIALLIGNQSYNAKVGPLKNPHNDITLIGAALEKLGFKTTLIKDADYRSVDAGIKRHVAMVRREGQGAISFVYYSGHGAADPDTKINYLIPVDVANADDEDLWHYSLNLNTVVEGLRAQAPGATHYVVFDACRNELNLTRKGQKALTDKGFVPMAYTPGVMVAYATAPGRTASDIGSGGGTYAKALAEEIVKPGVDSMLVFTRVARRVQREIGQDPFLSASTMPEVYFAREPTVPRPVVTPAPAPARLSEAAEAWDRAKDTNSITLLEAFITRFKDTFYAEMARDRLGELKKQQNAVSPVQPDRSELERAAAFIRDTEDQARLETFIKQFGDSPYAEMARARLQELRKKQAAVAIPPKAPPAKAIERCDGVETQVGNERKCLKQKDAFKDCSECPEMVVVPAGDFMMGSEEYQDEKPVHKVTIPKPFAVSKFEVTFAEWDACVSEGGCKHKPYDNGWGRHKRPAINVSWDDITKEYLPWLSRKTSKTYRLPTEAEWEYAARAGSRSKYSWGDEIGNNRAICVGCGSSWDNRQPAPIGSLQTNAFGLHDMHGNVWEWVADCYKDSYANAPSDGRAASDVAGCKRVLRGGSFDIFPGYLRSAYRHKISPDGRLHSFGFRLARTLNP